MSQPMTTTDANLESPRLGLWHRRVHPWLLDQVMDTAETRRIRQRVCAGLKGGTIVEVGFGTGLNLPHMPAEVTALRAVEPLRRGWELAQERIAAVDVDVDHVGVDARRLPLDDDSVDAVLCTWSLCSIDDAPTAVAEIGRILRPGGELHFVEHGLADDERVRRWQRRGDRLWSRLSCGCHLDRDIPAVIEAGGLRLVSLDTYYTDSEPKFLGWTFEGRAILA